MTEETKREQTLLEAAKAMLDLSLPLGEYPWDNLRAAISREEAKPADFWQTARWNRDDSERLSIALAALREEHAKFCREVFSGAHAKELRERAEKAEAESARLSAELARAKSDTRAKIQSELRSIERALCSVDVLNDFAGRTRDAYSCHVHDTIETAIGALRDDAATPPYLPPFEGDPKACAFPKPQQSHPMDGGEITVMLNRAGVKSWKGSFVNMTTPERIKWLIESWESARTQASNLERTRNALLDAIEKRKKESLDALNLLAKAIGGDS